MSQPYNPYQALQAATVCPHCGGTALTEPNAELRVVCAVCGGPRIEIKRPDVRPSGREIEPLQAARAAQKSRASWRGAAVVGGLLGIPTTLLFALGMLLSGWVAIGFAFSLPFLLLFVVALGKAKARTAEIRPALDRAWRSAARDVALAAKGGITAEQLAAALPIPPADAERLLAELTVDDVLRSEVTDEGALSFAPNQVRIEAGAPAEEKDELEARFEALAAEEAARAQQKRHQ